MNNVQWTILFWAILILVVPLILGFILKLGLAFLQTKSQGTQQWVEYWVTKFIEAAQQTEPDPLKRKLWVVAQILKMFPGLPEDQVSALVEAILNELKNTYDSWKKNGASATATPPPVGFDVAANP